METGRWWDVLRMRFRSLAKRQRLERELDKELRYHIERQTEENIAAGMNAREGRGSAEAPAVSASGAHCAGFLQEQGLSQVPCESVGFSGFSSAKPLIREFCDVHTCRCTTFRHG